MTCAATTGWKTAPAARNGACAAGPLPQAMTAPSAPCARAASTSHGPKPDGAASIIEKRAARLRHANQIQKARFIRLHQMLANRRSSDFTPSTGDYQ